MWRTLTAAAAVALAGCDRAGGGYLPTDTTAPEVSFAVPPPTNTTKSPLTIVVAASDGQSGVRAVHARVKAENNPVASLVDGTYDESRKVWELALPVENGTNAVLIWAVDVVGNSGEKLEAPYSLALSVTAALTPTVSLPVPVPPKTGQSPFPLVVVAEGGQGGGVTAVHARVKSASSPVAITVEGTYDAARGIWNLALPLEDGANSVLIWAVDGAGHSGEKLEAPYSLAVTITAALTPTVSLPIALPTRTGQSLLELAVRADGGEGGITAVRARVKPAATPVATTVDGTYDTARGVWLLALPLANGANSVLIWAVDAAGHSGEQLEAPYSLAATITTALTPTVSLPVPVPPKTGQSPFPLVVVAEGGQGGGVTAVHARVKSASSPVAITVEGTYDAARGIWNLALPLEDGANSVLIWAVDGAGHSGEKLEAPYSLHFDIQAAATPPTLSASEALPPWTNGHAVTLYLSAGDTGNGVASVMCAVGASMPVEAEQISGGWLCTLPLGSGANAISAWAADPQGRSGRGRGAPYEVTATVNQTRTAPVVEVGYYESYRPEAGASLRSAQVPPDVDLHGAAKISIGDGSTVSKILPRMSWGSIAPTADELEGANETNVPFVRFEVTAAAPLVSATAAITFPDFGGGGGPRTPPAVPLLASRRSVSGRSVYVLPLSRETLFPDYGSSSKYAQFAIDRPLAVRLETTVGDAAGNSGTLSITVYFELLGAPLYIEEDLQYSTSSAADELSIYHYRLSDWSYARIGGKTLAEATNMPASLKSAAKLRLIRYLVRNPWNEPLSLDALIGPPSNNCGGSNYSMWDLWEASSYEEMAWSESYNGLAPSQTWKYFAQAADCGEYFPNGCPAQAPGGCLEKEPDKTSNDNRLYPQLNLDGSWECISTPAANANRTLTEPLRPIAAANLLESLVVANGELGSVVPPAVGSTAGQADLFITRQVTDLTMRGAVARQFGTDTFTAYWPIQPQSILKGDPVDALLSATVYDYFRTESWIPCNYGFLNTWRETHCVANYRGYRLLRRVTEAREHICASLRIGSQIHDAQIGRVGKLWQAVTQPIARQIAH